MLVYFSGSAREIGDNIAVYRGVVGAIQEFGGIIAHNWPEAANMRTTFPRDQLWWESMCEDVQEAIVDADAVIVEASGRSTLGVGYELARALNLGKPVLALIKSNKSASYTRGIKHPSLQVTTYTLQNLAETIEAFLVEVNKR